MGSVLTPLWAPDRTPNCLGVYELHHPSSGRCLVAVARDLAHAKLHHLKKLAAGVHENQALQSAYQSDSKLDFVFYPVATYAKAQELMQEITAEMHLSGRLFEEVRRCALTSHKPPYLNS